ncbi:hypothetical protein AAG570_014010 [Ranatra chinensis]|uniref:Aminotransferase class I/classII large domain-containing protein n=1 Tax=Ranatra chinensis TaxID=642074 RepID=A0ABD0XS50_9HEMI
MMSEPGMISFGGGNPATEAFPSKEIRAISDNLLAEEPGQVLQYSLTEGYPALREQGKKYLNRNFDIVKEQDTVIVTTGSQQVMDLLGKIICNEGDVIATENPAFMGALNAFRSYGAKLVGIDMEPDGVNLAQLEAVLSAPQKPKVFYTIPNFQNPTGITTSLEKRQAVYELCAKYGVLILEDDPYGALRISGSPIAPIKSFDTAGIVMHASSFSKVLAPGMRLAMCAGPSELMAKMALAKQVSDVHTTLWSQRVCERFLALHDMEKHLERVSGIYRKKANLMISEFERLMGGRIKFNRPEGGMFVWVTLPDNIDTAEFVRRCLEKKLMLVPGNAFTVDENAKVQSVRTNFSTPTEEQIKAGAQIMASVLDELS